MKTLRKIMNAISYPFAFIAVLIDESNAILRDSEEEKI